MSGRKRYPRQEWYEFGKLLLQRRGGSEQREFLEACRCREIFLEYLNRLLPLEKVQGESALGGFDYKFAELEYIEPPIEPTQKYLWNSFRPIDGDGGEEIYADGCFWGVVVREMVERYFVDAPWLAANVGDTHPDSGLTNIEEALEEEGDNSAKAVDNCIRRILRSMCNPAPRGARIVFYDFPLGRSWWRWHWAERMADFLSIERDDILQLILTGATYELIAAKMHSGLSYLSPENVFGGLILFLQDQRDAPLPRKRLRKVIDELARQSAWRAIELRPPAENRDDLERLHRGLPED